MDVDVDNLDGIVDEQMLKRERTDSEKSSPSSSSSPRSRSLDGYNQQYLISPEPSDLASSGATAHRPPDAPPSGSREDAGRYERMNRSDTKRRRYSSDVHRCSFVLEMGKEWRQQQKTLTAASLQMLKERDAWRETRIKADVLREREEAELKQGWRTQERQFEKKLAELKAMVEDTKEKNCLEEQGLRLRRDEQDQQREAFESQQEQLRKRKAELEDEVGRLRAVTAAAAGELAPLEERVARLKAQELELQQGGDAMRSAIEKAQNEWELSSKELASAVRVLETRKTELEGELAEREQEFEKARSTMESEHEKAVARCTAVDEEGARKKAELEAFVREERAKLEKQIEKEHEEAIVRLQEQLAEELAKEERAIREELVAQRQAEVDQKVQKQVDRALAEKREKAEKVLEERLQREGAERLEGLQAQLEQANTELRHSRDKLEETEARCGELMTEFEANAKKIEKARQELKNLEEEEREELGRQETEKQRWAGEMSAAQDAIASVAHVLEKREKTAAELADEIKKQEEMLSASVANYALEEEKILELKEDVENVLAAHKQAKADLDAVLREKDTAERQKREAVDAKQKEETEWERRVADRKEELLQVESTAKEQAKVLEEMRTEMMELQSAMEKLEQEKAELKARVAKLGAGNVDLETDCDKLTREVEELKEEVAAQKSRVAEQAAEVAQAEKSAVVARHDVEYLTGEANKLMGRVESLNEQFTQQTEENERKHARGLELKQEINRLENQKREISNAVAESDIALLSQQSKLQDLAASKQQLESEAARRQDEMGELRKRHEALKKEIERDQAKILSAEVAELEARRRSVKGAVEDLDRDLGAKKVELAAVRGEAADLVKKRKQWTAELQRVQTEAEETRKQVGEVRGNIAALDAVRLKKSDEIMVLDKQKMKMQEEVARERGALEDGRREMRREREGLLGSLEGEKNRLEGELLLLKEEAAKAGVALDEQKAGLAARKADLEKERTELEASHERGMRQRFEEMTEVDEKLKQKQKLLRGLIDEEGAEEEKRRGVLREWKLREESVAARVREREKELASLDEKESREKSHHVGVLERLRGEQARAEKELRDAQEELQRAQEMVDVTVDERRQEKQRLEQEVQSLKLQTAQLVALRDQQLAQNQEDAKKAKDEYAQKLEKIATDNSALQGLLDEQSRLQNYVARLRSESRELESQKQLASGSKAGNASAVRARLQESGDDVRDKNARPPPAPPAKWEEKDGASGTSYSRKIIDEVQGALGKFNKEHSGAREALKKEVLLVEKASSSSRGAANYVPVASAAFAPAERARAAASRSSLPPQPSSVVAEMHASVDFADFDGAGPPPDSPGCVDHEDHPPGGGRSADEAAAPHSHGGKSKVSKMAALFEKSSAKETPDAAPSAAVVVEKKEPGVATALLERLRKGEAIGGGRKAAAPPLASAAGSSSSNHVLAQDQERAVEQLQSGKNATASVEGDQRPQPGTGVEGRTHEGAAVALARGEDKNPKTSTSAATAEADAVAGAKVARAVEQKDQDVESKQPKNALPTPLIAGGKHTAGTGLLDGGGGAATSERPDMDRARERLQLRGTEDTAQIRYGGSHRDNFLNALQRNQKPAPAPGGQQAGTTTAVASARAQQKSAATTSNAVLNTAALFSAGGGLSHLSGAGLLKGRKNNPSTLPAPKGASLSSAVANTRSFFATSSNARSPPPVKGATNDAPAPDSPQRTAQYCTKRRKIVFAEKSAGPAAAASLIVAKEDKDLSKQKHVDLNGGGDSDVKMDDAAVAGDDGAKANSQHSWVKPTTAAVTTGAQTASGNQKPNDQHGCTVKDKDVGAEKGGSAAAAAASSAGIPAAVRLRVGEEKPTGAAEPEKTPNKKQIAEIKEAARGAPSGDKASTKKEERNKADPAPEGDEAEHEIPADTTNAKMKNAPGSARAPPPISGKRGGRKKRQAATFDDDSPPFELEAQPPSQSSVIRSTKSLRGEVAEAGPAGGGNSSSSSSGSAADTSTSAAAAAASSSSASGAGATSSASNAANRAGSAKNGLRRYPTPILEVPEEEEEGDSNQGLQPDQIRQKALHKRGKGSSAAAAPPTDENARPDAVSTPRGGRDGGRGGSSKKKTKCKYNMDDLKKKTVPELKAILDAQNQKTTGKKEELAQRILSNPEKYPASFRTPKLKKAQGARQLR